MNTFPAEMLAFLDRSMKRMLPFCLWILFCAGTILGQTSQDIALIPAGNFQMGNLMDPVEGNADELPVHTVYVSAFYMDRYEVTKARWDDVRAWGLIHGYTDIPAGSGKAATHPVQTISWYNMVKWCNARSEMEGLTPVYFTDDAQTVLYQTGNVNVTNAQVKWSANGYRLPTEAEWEKAARGGTSGHRFPWSNVETITHSQANYSSSASYSYDVSPTRGYHPTFAVNGGPYTSPVGYFASNGYGLYDMAGNVWEWCWDWYGSSYYSTSPSIDPQGSPTGSVRVLRGGSWIDDGGAHNCRVANRDYRPPVDTDSSKFGFRCVRGITAKLVSLALNGAPSVAAGSKTNYTATAYFSDGTTQDVSAQAAWTVRGGPAGTTMTGPTLQAGSGPAGVAHMQAIFGHDTALRTASGDVSITAGMALWLETPQTTYASGTGGTLNYQLSAAAHVTGGNGTYFSNWTLNGTPVSSGNGLTLNTLWPASPGPGTLAVTVTDGTGLICSNQVYTSFGKAPQTNEQFPQVKTTGVAHAGTRKAADGVSDFTFPGSATRKAKGLIVIIHGMDDSVASGWMKTMADAIKGQFGGEANSPNIILYDWHEDAALGGNGNELLEQAKLDMIKVLSPRNDMQFAEAGWVFAENIYSVRGMGENHGAALAEYLSRQMDSDLNNIDQNAPIQLIGHSAGGFVAASCGKLLLFRGQAPTKLQVTTLDTPMLRSSAINDIKNNGGKFDRYTSSVFGELTQGIVKIDDLAKVDLILGRASALALGVVVSVHPFVGFLPSATYHSGHDAEADSKGGYGVQHNDSYRWYTETVSNFTGTYTDGFYYSPFLNNPFPVSLAPLAAPMFAKAALLGTLPALTGFSTFGSVSETSGSYTLVEQGNAGIYQNVTFPMNASTLKFNVQFTQAGDGDFVEVSFGGHLALATIPDGSTMRGGPVQFEVPIVHLGGETGQLLFKLNGVGQDNAAVRIDSITITTDDDADGDGLTFAQETALGTDPRYSDTDADGLSDADEVNVYLTNPLLADSDGDGISDGDEIAAGTNPLDPKSGFKVVAAQRLANGSFALSWSAIAGKTYRVLRSTTVDFANFDVLAAGIEPVATTASYTDASLPPGTTTAFYRVQME